MAGFDPDAYLNATGGFDPDAYLSNGAAAPEKPKTGRKESAARGALQGLSLGWGDEGAAGIAALLPFTDREAAKGDTLGERYRNARELYRGRNTQAKESNPITYGANEIGGALAPMLLSGGAAAARAPTLLGRMGQAAATGAKIGSVAGAGYSDAKDATGLAGDTAGGAIGGAVLGPAVEAAGAGASRAGRWVSDKLGGLASEAARRSTGATQVDITKLTRENPARPAQVGRALLDEKIRLRSPDTIAADAKRIRGDVGAEIGTLLNASDASGARFNAGQFVADAKSRVVNPIANNPLQKVPGHHGQVVNPAAERLNVLLNEVTAKAQNGALTANEAHLVRKQLDEFLRGVRRSQDPESTVLKSAVNDIRGMLSDELGATVNRAGQGPAWAEANRRYGLASDIGKLAKKGQDRRLGNNAVFGFTQQVSGAGPGSLLGALNSPDDRWAGAMAGGAAGLAGTTLAYRYGAPVIARSAQSLSKALAGRGGPGPLTPAAERAAILAQILRGRPTLNPTAVAAEDEDPR
jgi:hypothetical protein